jgi:hypothetical protein
MLQNTKNLRFLLFNVFLMLIGIQTVFSQDTNNYLDVSSSIKNVNLNSVSTLETEQVQSNAFAITIKSRNNSFSVYATISFYSSSNGYVLPSNMLSIKLNNVNPSRTANFNEIPITGGNQLIIQGVKTNTSTVTYTYDMYIGPIGFDSPPGTYNATVLFTLTQQ